MLRGLVFRHVKQLSSWRKLAQVLKSNRELAGKLGFAKPPCHASFSDFTRRVGDETLTQIFKMLVARLKLLIPDLGRVVAIDSTLVRAYSKPRRKGKRKTDPDAAWGVSGQKLGKPIFVYGYKLQVGCDAERDIPVSFAVAPANRSEARLFRPHLQSVLADGHRPDVLTADAGYDSKRNNMACLQKGIKPVIALNPRRSGNRKARRADYILPIPRGSDEWQRYYSMRSSVERVFSRLKEELGLLPLRLRTTHRVTVHFALCLIAMLLIALASFAIGRPDLYLSVEPWRY